MRITVWIRPVSQPWPKPINCQSMTASTLLFPLVPFWNSAVNSHYTSGNFSWRLSRDVCGLGDNERSFTFVAYQSSNSIAASRSTVQTSMTNYRIYNCLENCTQPTKVGVVFNFLLKKFNKSWDSFLLLIEEIQQKPGYLLLLKMCNKCCRSFRLFIKKIYNKSWDSFWFNIKGVQQS